MMKCNGLFAAHASMTVCWVRCCTKELIKPLIQPPDWPLNAHITVPKQVKFYLPESNVVGGNQMRRQMSI